MVPLIIVFAIVVALASVWFWKPRLGNVLWGAGFIVAGALNASTTFFSELLHVSAHGQAVLVPFYKGIITTVVTSAGSLVYFARRAYEGTFLHLAWAMIFRKRKTTPRS